MRVTDWRQIVLGIMQAFVLAVITASAARAQTDMAITQTASATAAPGQNLTYKIGVSNVHSSDTPGSIQLTNNLPPHTTLVSARQTSGPYSTISAPSVGGSGTVRVNLSSLFPDSIKELCAVGTTLYFRAYDDKCGAELWKSNGMTSGTARVKDIISGIGSSDPKNLISFKSRLYFVGSDADGSDELWRSDGTVGGTIRIKEFRSSLGHSRLGNFTHINNILYFWVNEPTHGTELWRSDGTTAGTVLLKDINAGSSSSNPHELININGTVYFSANDGINGRDLWKTDGTEKATVRVRNVGSENGALNPSGLINFNGTLFFEASDNNDRELWKSDGTPAGTMRVTNLNLIGEANITSPKVYNGFLYFAANDSYAGRALWKSDGTAAGTVKVKETEPPYFVEYGTPVKSNGILFFVASRGDGDYELWKTNGTSVGTGRVKDINPDGSSAPYFLTDVNGTLYFSANGGYSGTELWKSNGTAAGTIRVKDINPGRGSAYPYGFTTMNGLLFFAANRNAIGYELWKSDGTEEGTVRVYGDFVEKATFEITVKIDEDYVGSLSNTVSLSTLSKDINLSDNSATVVTQVSGTQVFDTTKPTVTIDYPAANAKITGFTESIRGTVRDTPGIWNVKQLYLRLSRTRNAINEFWDPTSARWTTSAEPFLSTTPSRPSVTSYWKGISKLPSGAQLPSGAYVLTVTARDAAGNAGRATVNFTVSSATAQNVATIPASNVRLSSATASTKGFVVLTFTGALGSNANDANRYGVTANGTSVSVTSAQLSTRNTVELALDTLPRGTLLMVHYRIDDIENAPVAGTASAVVQ
ncbi:MAG TPA: ELWxxDGT repeat protein [Abditibacteriaceae bacterium]|jgi:uncharacterized repeat protein (TIGR01451 family)